MRLKWIAFCFLLGFIVILDPTQTPAQFGRKGGGDFGKGGGGDRGPGGFGGKRGDFGKGGGFGGNPAAPPAAPVDKPVVLYGAGPTTGDKPTIMMTPGGGTAYPAPSGGYPSSGFPGGSGFGGQGGDRGPGGFGGGRGMMGDPAARWEMMAQGKDSINLNDPQHSRTRGFMEKMGRPIPADGILTKQAYLASASNPMGGMGGMGGMSGSSPGGPMSISLTPSGSGSGMTFSLGGDRASFGGGDRDRGADRLREQDRDGDGRVSRAEADDRLKPNFDRIDVSGDGFITLEEYRGYYANQGGGGGDRNRGGFDMANLGGWGSGNMGGWGSGDMGGWGNRMDPRRDPNEEPKPVAVRYGHLPKDLPDWFDEYDSTKDGQVALHEWRKAGESIESFATYDLNKDGLITSDEVIRGNRQKSEADRISAIMDGTGSSTRPSFSGRGPGGRGPGGPPMGITVPGTSLDPATNASIERERKPGRDGDKSEKPAREEKSEKSSEKSSEKGNNGPWGNGGKKNRN